MWRVSMTFGVKRGTSKNALARYQQLKELNASFSDSLNAVTATSPKTPMGSPLTRVSYNDPPWNSDRATRLCGQRHVGIVSESGDERQGVGYDDNSLRACAQRHVGMVSSEIDERPKGVVYDDSPSIPRAQHHVGNVSSEIDDERPKGIVYDDNPLRACAQHHVSTISSETDDDRPKGIIYDDVNETTVEMADVDGLKTLGGQVGRSLKQLVTPLTITMEPVRVSDGFSRSVLFRKGV
ncbi:hypothetical protein BC829DRAFT_249476 [Chytridium lagenaria]|nr:hypothetical protein BC829DRAFT_249476 [Chytridium lagenaria]